MTTGRINQVTILRRTPEGTSNPPERAEQFTVARAGQQPSFAASPGEPFAPEVSVHAR